MTRRHFYVDNKFLKNVLKFKTSGEVKSLTSPLKDKGYRLCVFNQLSLLSSRNELRL
jgi:hypothetical protein